MAYLLVDDAAKKTESSKASEDERVEERDRMNEKKRELRSVCCGGTARVESLRAGRPAENAKARSQTPRAAAMPPL